MLKKFIVVALILSISACSSMYPIDKTAVNTEIEAGDKVRIVTKDAKEIEFQVREVSDTSIVGQTESVQKDEIETIEKKQISPIKTVFAGIITLGVVGFANLAAEVTALLP
jgi:hypothetical protein